MTFYEVLDKLMKENRVTAKELSESQKIGKNQFKYWKDNGNIPNGETLIALANYFNCSVDYLLGRTDQPDMQATITVGNITGDNNANLSINNTDCDQFMKEFYRIISQMDFRQRTELMLMIYNYIDNKKSR